MNDKKKDELSINVSIGQAARLIGVSENTLREWDFKEKLIAARTEGNHRRYGIDQIKEYIKKTSHINDETPHLYESSDLMSKWSAAGWMDENMSTKDRRSLAFVLESAATAYSFDDNRRLSLDQTLLLVKEAWLRSVENKNEDSSANLV